MIGKKIGARHYIHIDVLPKMSASLRDGVARASTLAHVEPGREFNVVRFDPEAGTIALLDYSEFFDAPFPPLKKSWLVYLDREHVSYRTYENSINPPILHRKELLIEPDHPRREQFSALTASAEEIGLFEDSKRIGYHVQWTHLIRERGYEVSDHQLIPIGNDLSGDVGATLSETERIARHRTALVRYGFSAPIQSLGRHGYLDGSHTLFDYGCGRGDDLRGLTENGIVADGWDPYYAPEREIKEADIVNLGFVINVIDDFDERIEALSRAYALAKRFLVVSAMLTNNNAAGCRRFNDGVLTKRGTFQKYFTQAELSAFISAVLDEDPIAAGPGVFLVFRDKDYEQRFLAKRYRRNHSTESLLAARAHRQQRRSDLDAQKYKDHQGILEALWDRMVELGRIPDPIEAPMHSELVGAFGTLLKAVRFILRRKDPTVFEAASAARQSDLTVYLALELFEQRKGYKHLEPGLKRDIKAFYGSVKAAKDAARQLLFKIADTDAISEACEIASEQGLGHYIPGESLQLHTSLINQLPPILRVYSGCASAMYGDCHEADLIKIHIDSGKLTLMRFDDFEGSPLPRMIERVKLKLREQDINYFEYDGDAYEAPYLYQKSRFINEEFPHYPDQIVFDEQLSAMRFLNLSGYGPSYSTLQELLRTHRYEVQGFELNRVHQVPELDAKCGRYLMYRQLIECGKTQRNTGIPNLPTNPDSYSALLDLAVYVLDPIIEYFGMIELTYGFCSAKLEKAVPGGIAPRLDQHAAHEKRKNGRHVCNRLGAAADFIVRDENMEEVAAWAAENTPFDRLYYYGQQLPIHISYGPTHARQFVLMQTSKNGRLMPRIAKPTALNNS